MRRLLPLLFLLACEPPEPPFVCAPPPQLTVFAGEWASGRLCFEDPEGAKLRISLSLLHHLPVGQVQVWGQDSIRVLGRWPGSTVVTVTATDPDGLEATQDVPVLVPNRAPVGSPDDAEVPARFSATIDLSEHFSDPDGQPLTYSAYSLAPSVVDVAALSDSLLHLNARATEGSARISVTASDGADSVTRTFEATIVPSLIVLSDEFDSDASLDDWAPARHSSAKIEDGYFVLTADSTAAARAWQGFGGVAAEWIVDITLRTTEAGAQAGFRVATGAHPIGFYRLYLGEATVPGFPSLNWIFSWWDANQGWVTQYWGYGTSSDVRDFADVEVSLSMTEEGVRATVDGKLLFERRGVAHWPRTGVGLYLSTRPEGEGGVASSMNRVHVITPELDEEGSPPHPTNPTPR